MTSTSTLNDSSTAVGTDEPAEVLSRRWLVEIDPKYRAGVGEFEDVGAESVTVEAGCLVFRDGDEITFIRAAGTWNTCVPNHE